MDRRLLMGATMGAALAVIAAPAVAQGAPKLETPLAAVQRLYDPKVKDAQRPYSKKLRGLYAAAQKKSKQLGEVVPGLDFDPLTGSQDADDDYRKSLKYAVEPRGEGRALVVVKLKVFASEPEITLHIDLVREGSDWRIDDIANPVPGENGWRWSNLLILGAKGG